MQEQIPQREEILAAAQSLYETHNYRDISLKDISEVTSFSRPTIYNYFHTKEEIFLGLITREYDSWAAEMYEWVSASSTSGKVITRENFAELVAGSLEKRELMLKLISSNLTDLEEGASQECIDEFKRSYGATLSAMNAVLKVVDSNVGKKKRENFIYAFFPFLYGIWPYVHATKKQQLGLEHALVKFELHSVHDLVRNLVDQLLIKG
ncbi:TetR family transcriptional regulator [Alloscardovia venturai]|uniref:TetR family transcriptional regulator n=1 Tax=Alloscardovia venturai TaxID=1769421 RepID=A0ABW2Y550_9BIFI